MAKFDPTLRVGSGCWLAATLLLAAWLAWPLRGTAATIVVTNLANNGPGTLRTLLPTARNGDVVTFAVTGIITNVISVGLTISNNISIVGPGPDLLTITGTNWFRAFRVNNGATASISGLTFYRCSGSAINNSATFTVSNCIFNRCYGGGGINNASNLVVLNSTFTDCRGLYGSSTYSEDIPGTSGGSGANGGAIVNSGTMSVVNSQFLTNTAGWGGDGTPGDVPSFYRPNFPITTGGNGGDGGNGGAVYDVGMATFTNCTFGWNTSGAGGSGAQGGSGVIGPSPNFPTYPGTGKRGGNAGKAGNGSAVYSSGGARFVSCTFFNNTLGSGGNGGNGGDGYGYIFPNTSNYPGGSGGNAGNAGSGTLYCTGTCQLIACTFYQNNAGFAGNGGNGGAGVNNSSIPGGNGGNGGNAGNGGSGGAIYGPTNNTSFTLQNVLVAQNTASYAGYAGSAGAGGSGAVYGSNGSPGTNALDGTGPDLAGKFISHKHNLVGLSNGNTGFTNNLLGDIVGTDTPIDPLIGALANNGGFVSTCALLPGSPALDAGDDTLLGAPLNLNSDARGAARQGGAHVDIGAYEYQSATLPIACHTAVTEAGVRLSVSNVPGAVFTVLGTTDLTLPAGSWDVLGQMSEIAPGQFQWTDTGYGNYDFRFFSVRSP